MHKVFKTRGNCSEDIQVSFEGIVHGGEFYESGFQIEICICRQSGLKDRNRNKVPKAGRPYDVTVS